MESEARVGPLIVVVSGEMNLIQQRIQRAYSPNEGERGVRVLPLSEWRAEQARLRTQERRPDLM